MSAIKIKDMVKKNYSLQSNEAVLSSIVGWRPPVFHQKSECYVSFLAFDPSFGRLRRKRIMLDKIKGKRKQREYADAQIGRASCRERV